MTFAEPPPARHGAQHRRSGSAARRSVARRIAQVVAALVSAFLLVGFGYGWYEYRSLDSGLHRVHLANLAPAGGSGQHRGHGVAQNILLVGIDSRDGLSAAEQQLLSVGHDMSTSTDTIMVVHVPADGSAATMISIPRDSYVDIPGPAHYVKNKINSAYASAYTDKKGSAQQKQQAGMDELIKTVEELTGLPINHYIQVGFGGFYTITKALHGITVNLCAGTDDTIAHNIAEGNGRVGSNFKMTAGRHDLTPVQAFEFVRQRHNLKGEDIAREKRQRYFLSAAFDKIASAGVLLDPSQLNKLIKAVTGAFTVDDTLRLTDLADQMANLSAKNITGFTIPIDGQQRVSILGQPSDVELVTPAKVQAAIAKALAPVSHPHSSTSRSAAPASQHATPHGCIY